MVTSCAASSKLALSVTLRNVYRSQMIGSTGALVSPYHGRFSFYSPVPSSHCNFRRLFSSSSYLRDPQNESSELTPPDASTSVDAAPSQRKPRKTFDRPGDKGGWNSHKRQPKSQKQDSEQKSGRTDRERRAFRNETRREIKKQPRNWEEDKAKAREEVEKQRRKKPENWQVQKAALKEKFAGGWNPPKKLSPDALDGIRHLHAKAPEQFTTAVLAREFEMSPEAIRRILKSRWRPTEDEMDSRRQRWEKRHDRIWSRMVELGLRPSNNREQPSSDYHVLYKDNANDRKSS